jgi:hypothetical protein
MKIFAAATAIAVALSATPALAASIDLSAFGLTEGAIIGQSDQAQVAFLPDFGLLTVDVDDGPLRAFFNLLIGDPAPAFLDIVTPVAFSGQVVDFHIGATSAAGLFFDGMGHVLALLDLPAGSVFDIASIDLEGFFVENASVTLREADAINLAPIPLPAAAPLLLAGLGAIAVIGRRRARRAAEAQATA